MNNSSITHAILRPDAFNADVHRIVTEAMQQGIDGVMLPPVWISRTATMIRGSGVRLCSTVSFPHGTSKSTVKAIEATSTIKDGADEIAIVPHAVAFLRQDLQAARYELLEIVRAARAARRDVFIKVIVPEALNEEPAYEFACRAIRESACDGILVRTSEVEAWKKHSHDLVLDVWSDNVNLDRLHSLAAAGADRLTIQF